ncbi:MAG: glmU [Bacilli bacterium]|nr:glmU [Bacilli bacterium]
MADSYAVILAAGQGTRMKSKTHKVLHPLCGKPMIRHVTDSLKQTGVNRLFVVVGALADQVKQELGAEAEFIHQEQQLGTGHAVMQARSVLAGLAGYTLVCYGDTPLVSRDTYLGLLAAHEESGAAVTMLTALVPQPFGLGRIIRNDAGEILSIVEEKDATPEQKLIQEINPGLYCFTNSVLFSALDQLTNNNAQGEYYLTDIIGIIRRQGLKIASQTVSNADEILGVNDRVQLASLQTILQKQINERHMRNGVTLIDPQTTYIDVDVQIGSDTVVAPGVTLSGATAIGESCWIGSGTQINTSTVGDRVHIQSSIIMESAVADDVEIGPFAYLRPGCKISSGVKVGDFVELKNTSVGDGSKIPHLAYLGDADVGSNTNIGCGVVTANYDGFRKHRTVVGSGSFVGCNTNLIAPVTVGNEVYIATGSTITDDIPDGAFAIARQRQTIKENYVDKLKTRLREGDA